MSMNKSVSPEKFETSDLVCGDKIKGIFYACLIFNTVTLLAKLTFKKILWGRFFLKKCQISVYNK